MCASGYTGDGFSSCALTTQSTKSLSVFIGVAITGLALIAITVVTIIVLVCVVKRKVLPIIKNVEHLPNTQADFLESNAAYTTVTGQDPTFHLTTNKAYGIASATNEDIYSSTIDGATDISTSPNQAYQATGCLSSSNAYEYPYDYILQNT